MRTLATARAIVTLLYVIPLVIFPFVPRLVGPEVSVGADALRVLAPALIVVGVMDYAISLFLEQKMLTQARVSRQHNQVATAAIVVAALGASLAVYGLVLTLLGAASWGAVLYVLCAAHGLHLIVRWPRYARATQGTPYE
jgi:hypothetical protein